MALLNVPIYIVQGEDWTNTWIFASPDPSGQGNLANMVYYNFTGASLRMMVRATQDPSSAVILNVLASGTLAFTSAQSPGGPAAPAFTNAIVVTIPKAASLGLQFGSYYHDLFVDWMGGTSTQMLAGPFEIAASGTR